MQTRKSGYLLNKLEKTDFNHIEGYPKKGSFSMVTVEINNEFFYLVRGIKNKCFFEGIFEDEERAKLIIEEKEKG